MAIMKNNVKLSYIVPAFNMEKYLRICINSILSQNTSDFEIIIVNDGSTDATFQISEEIKTQYDNVAVIHKKNGGISSARNAGLAVAKGEYVCFVDSDDFYKKGFATEFLEICEKEELDIIRGWYGIYDEESESYLEHPLPKMSFVNHTVTGQEFLCRSITEQCNEVVPWLGFFRREYLMSNNLTFPEGIAYEEDQLFFLRALLCDVNCRIYQSDIEFYAYRKRAGSATKTPTLKQIKDILFVVEQETIMVKKYNLIGNVKEAALRYICSSFYQLTSIYGRLNKEDKDQVARITPFWMKWQCICHPYDRHQQIKIVLFTFVRWFVDLVYRRRGLK